MRNAVLNIVGLSQPVVNTVLIGVIIVFCIGISWYMWKETRTYRKTSKDIEDTLAQLDLSVTHDMVAVVVSDKSGKILGWNATATYFFGYQENEVLGQSITMLMPDRYKLAHTTWFQHFVDTGQGKLIGKTVRLFARHKAGVEFPINLTLNGNQNERGIVTAEIKLTQ